MRARPILAFLAAALCSAPAGCGGTAGTTAGTSTNVPGIPVYPGAKLTDSWPASSVQTPSISLSEDTSRDPTDFYFIRGADQDRVVEWYAERMPPLGWHAVGDPMQDVVLYNDDRGCYGFVSATDAEDGVDLQISRQDPATPCQIVPTMDPGTE